MCNDDEVHKNVRLLRDHGRDTSGDVVIWGLNSRLDNLQAAILLHSFRYYDEVIKRRREVARRYHEVLNELEEVTLPPAPEDDSDHFDVYQNYEIEAEDRDNLKIYLEKNEVGTLVQWGGKAVHEFRKLGFAQRLPNTERLFKKMIMLPLNMSITNEQVDYVCENIFKFYR